MTHNSIHSQDLQYRQFKTVEKGYEQISNLRFKYNVTVIIHSKLTDAEGKINIQNPPNTFTKKKQKGIVNLLEELFLFKILYKILIYQRLLD